jgi:hypothetical protein
VAEDSQRLGVIQDQPAAERPSAFQIFAYGRRAATARAKAVGNDQRLEALACVPSQQATQGIHIVVRETPHGNPARCRSLDTPPPDGIQARIHVDGHRLLRQDPKQVPEEVQG